MGCCGQTTAGTGAGASPIDDNKRVNYTLGMLLGVDDFLQEQAYHGARRREMARELLGYGTVRGLQVGRGDDGDNGPVLSVASGIAWLPSGQPVCVPSTQCLTVNDWLQRPEIAQEVNRRLLGQPASPPPLLSVYVVLGHDESEGDAVPIPGEPCRSESQLTRASRIADGYTLELRFRPPAQLEEDAVRDLVAWLTSIPAGETSPPMSNESFESQIRDAAQAWIAADSPPNPNDFLVGLPPAADRASDHLVRAALRLWVTELRPLWHARYGCDCDCRGGSGRAATAPLPEDDVVLLAELQLALVPTTAQGDWRLADSVPVPMAVDVSRRPVVLSLRMVQELATMAPLPSAGDTVTAARSYGLLDDPGSSWQFARADHTHGTPPAPAPAPVPPPPPPAPAPAPAPSDLVAAGEVMLALRTGITGASVATSIGGFAATTAALVTGVDNRVDIGLIFSGATPGAEFVVQLTPLWPAANAPTYRLFLAGPVSVARNGAATLSVVMLADSGISADAFDYRFQVAVRQFISEV